MIVLWGPPDDGPLAAIAEQLDELDVPFLPWEPDAAPETEVEIETGPDGALAGWVRARGARLDLSNLSALYARHGEMDPRLSGEAARHAAALLEAFTVVAELTPALVVNRPSAMAPNGSKPLQLAMIARHGFRVPDTLVTTDPEAARAFWRLHGEVIYKSVSSVRSAVSRLRPEHEARLRDIGSCPTQLQRWIEGTDYRVHVVGEQVFATEIACSADDYRFARGDATPRFREAELPSEIEERCRTLAKEMGLSLAGVDLRRDAGGTWWCFEVNPSPAFSYYERATGQPVARAVAELLISPSG